MTKESEETLRFRERFHQDVHNQVIKAERRGADEDKIAETIREAISNSSRSMAETLVADRPRMLDEHAAVWADVERIIRETWGSPLDKLYAVIVSCEELGRIWNYSNIADAEAEGDAMFPAMSGVSARGIRTAFEVHLLLSRGFAAGAAARARSIYELAVVARVLAIHGPGSDLPQRYLDHRWIDQRDWAVEIQRRSGLAEDVSLPLETLQELESRREKLLERYGGQFGQRYGWAAVLFNGGRISPTRLATTVDMEDGRPHYMAQSHELHPTALGGEMNLELGGQVASWRLTGLAEPANATMVRLAQILSDTLTNGRTGVVNYYDVLGITTVFHLVEEAEQAFVAAEETAEHRIAVDPVHPEPPPLRPSREWASDD